MEHAVTTLQVETPQTAHGADWVHEGTPIRSERDLRARARQAINADRRIDAIFLFGSRARGTARPNSDWDIAIVSTNDRIPTLGSNVDTTRIDSKILQRGITTGSIEAVVVKYGRIIARTKGWRGCVSALVAAGADLNARDNRGGGTPLHRAASGGKVTKVEALVAAGADINARDNDGATPLHHATAEYGFYEEGVCDHAAVAEALLAAGADPYAGDNNGSTPLHSVGVHAHPFGHIAVIRAFRAAGANLNVGDSEGLTPLHIAARMDHAPAVRALLTVGADINARDKRGGAALHSAVLSGSIEAIGALGTAGADINARDAHGRTPLDVAVDTAFLGGTVAKKIEALATAGADINAKDNYGHTPLHTAAMMGYAEAIHCLLDVGADPNVLTDRSRTPLDQWKGEQNDAFRRLRDATEG